MGISRRPSHEPPTRIESLEIKRLSNGYVAIVSGWEGTYSFVYEARNLPVGPDGDDREDRRLKAITAASLTEYRREIAARKAEAKRRDDVARAARAATEKDKPSGDVGSEG